MNEFQTVLFVSAPYFFYLLGGLFRIVVPFVVARAQNDIAFDTGKIKGQIVGWLAGLIPVILLSAQWVDDIGALSYLAAAGAGWLAGDLGREGQKVAALKTGGG